MADISKELQFLLASKAFQALLNDEAIKLDQLCAVQALLIKAGIPFDLIFTPGTRRAGAEAALTIHINPTTEVTFAIGLGAGASFLPGFIPSFPGFIPG